MAFLLLHRDDRRREAVQRRPVGLIDAEEKVEFFVRDGEPVGGILRRILRQDNINGTIIIRFQTGTVIYAVTINRIINQEIIKLLRNDIFIAVNQHDKR